MNDSKPNGVYVHSTSGMMLMEIVIVAALIGIIALVSASMIANQQREARALTEKLVAIEVSTRLKNVLVKKPFCGCLFQNSTFNTTPGALAFSAIPTSIPDSFVNTAPPPASCVTSPSSIVPPAGSPVESSHVIVDGIQVTDIVHQMGAYYTANLTVSFKGSTLVRDIKPIKSAFSFTVDTTTGSPTARNFVDCSSNEGTAVSESKVKYSAWVTTAASVSCDPGFKLSQCTIQVNSTDGMSMFYRQLVNYTLDSFGNAIGCDANMTDTNDSYRLAAVCIR